MAQAKNIASKFMNRMFRRVGGVVWDITTGKLGLKDDNGIYTLEVTTVGEGVKAKIETQIVVNPFDAFGIDIPAFATSTKLTDVAVGDVIVGDSKILGFVAEKKDNSLVLLDQHGMRKQYNPPKVAVLGTDNNVLVMKNLMNLTGESGLQGLQGSLMPLLMMGGDLDLESILPMMLFSQTSGGGAQNGMQAMLPLLMMKNGGLGGSGGAGGSKIDPMMLMMMGGMGGGSGGAGGMNPMMMMALMGGGDLFGGSDKPSDKTSYSSLPTAINAKPPLTRL